PWRCAACRQNVPCLIIGIVPNQTHCEECRAKLQVKLRKEAARSGNATGQRRPAERSVGELGPSPKWSPTPGSAVAQQAQRSPNRLNGRPTGSTVAQQAPRMPTEIAYGSLCRVPYIP